MPIFSPPLVSKLSFFSAGGRCARYVMTTSSNSSLPSVTQSFVRGVLVLRGVLEAFAFAASPVSLPPSRTIDPYSLTRSTETRACSLCVNERTHSCSTPVRLREYVMTSPVAAAEVAVGAAVRTAATDVARMMQLPRLVTRIVSHWWQSIKLTHAVARLSVSLHEVAIECSCSPNARMVDTPLRDSEKCAKRGDLAIVSSRWSCRQPRWKRRWTEMSIPRVGIASTSTQGFMMAMTAHSMVASTHRPTNPCKRPATSLSS
mmetsp:Transcript_61043/g.125922  ORF Transcript_61043/g.125922 Transcript_61043/m.125922 type:complete len:260 (+) Transcript_61043:745-1524(+)